MLFYYIIPLNNFDVNSNFDKIVDFSALTKESNHDKINMVINMFSHTADFGIKISTVTKLSWKRSEHNVAPRSLHALVYRKKGTASFSFDDGTELFAKAGEILYCPAGKGYNVKYDDGEITVFHFYAVGLPSEPKVKCIPFTERIEGLFEDAFCVWEEHRNGYYYKVLSLMFEILSLCSFDQEKSSDHKPEYKTACDHLKNNIYDGQLSVSGICRKYMIAETGFRRYFGEVYGISPTKYITEMRLREAERLLISSDHTIENIALRCGFNDVKYFSRVFSKHRGCPPSKFRKY